MPDQEQLIENSTLTVEGTLGAMIETWNRHDMDAMEALFAPNADFVNVVGMHFKGSAEIAAAHRLLHNNRFAHTWLKQLQASVNYIISDIALAHVRWEMIGDPAAGPSGIRRGTMTHVLVRKDSQWLFRSTQNTDIVRVPEMENDPFWKKFM